MRILIVDDEYNNRILMQRILEPIGRCDVVINGQEAVEMFEMAMVEGEPYRLVCLDIMMPGMDGQAALKAMRQIEKVRGVLPADEAAVIMTSALDTPKEVIHAFYQGGCTDYLVKPILQEKLLEKLRDCGVI